MKKKLCLPTILLACLLVVCCCKSTAPQEIDTLININNTVHIQLWNDTDLLQSGSGVLIKKTPESAIVITNAHVVSVRVGSDPLTGFNTFVCPGIVTVVTTSGQHLIGRVIDITAKENGDGDAIDLAIIELYMPPTLPKPPEISLDGTQMGEDIIVVPYAPYASPISLSGKRTPEGKYGHYLKTSSPIIPGNSGSPVYESTTGKLCGIIWGKESEGNGGYYVDSVDIVARLREKKIIP